MENLRLFREKETLELIQMYRLSPCLWDKKDALYGSKVNTEQMYLQMITQLNLPVSVQDVKAKIKNLRSTYWRTLKASLAESSKPGAASQPQWMFFQEMDFLRPLYMQFYYQSNDYINQPLEESSTAAESPDTSSSKSTKRPQKRKHAISSAAATPTPPSEEDRRTLTASVKFEDLQLQLKWEGFVYELEKASRFEGHVDSEWRCGEFDSGCQGKVIMVQDESSMAVKVMEFHSHDPDDSLENRIPKLSRMQSECGEENMESEQQVEEDDNDTTTDIFESQDTVLLDNPSASKPKSGTAIQSLEDPDTVSRQDLESAVKLFSAHDREILLCDDYPVTKLQACSLCGRTFALMRTLETHQILEHKIRAEYRCERCGMQFLLEEYLGFDAENLCHNCFKSTNNDEAGSTSFTSSKQGPLTGGKPSAESSFRNTPSGSASLFTRGKPNTESTFRNAHGAESMNIAPSDDAVSISSSSRDKPRVCSPTEQTQRHFCIMAGCYRRFKGQAAMDEHVLRDHVLGEEDGVMRTMGVGICANVSEITHLSKDDDDDLPGFSGDHGGGNGDSKMGGNTDNDSVAKRLSKGRTVVVKMETTVEKFIDDNFQWNHDHQGQFRQERKVSCDVFASSNSKAGQEIYDNRSAGTTSAIDKTSRESCDEVSAGTNSAFAKSRKERCDDVSDGSNSAIAEASRESGDDISDHSISEITKTSRDVSNDVSASTNSAKRFRYHRRKPAFSRVANCRVVNAGIRNKESAEALVGVVEQKEILRSKTPRSFKCQLCPAVFPYACQFRYHMRIHSDERPYQCNSCPQKFKSASARMAHVRRIHECVRSHLCQFCGKKFKDLASVRIHTDVIHIGTKKYSCTVCDRQFNRINTLNVHMRQHTGVKPYVCDQCGQAFTVNVSLRTHLKSKHGIVPPPGARFNRGPDPGDNSMPVIGRPPRKYKSLAASSSHGLDANSGSSVQNGTGINSHDSTSQGVDSSSQILNGESVSSNNSQSLGVGACDSDQNPNPNPYLKGVCSNDTQSPGMGANNQNGNRMSVDSNDSQSLIVGSYNQIQNRKGVISSQNIQSPKIDANNQIQNGKGANSTDSQNPPNFERNEISVINSTTVYPEISRFQGVVNNSGFVPLVDADGNYVVSVHSNAVGLEMGGRRLGEWVSLPIAPWEMQ